MQISLINMVGLIVTLNLLLMVKSAVAQTVIWSGHDATNSVNTNWSDANNWTGGLPGPATNVFFFDTGANATQGQVNNSVDANTTVLSLQYGNTNGFHTTQINTGVRLAVSNNAAANLVFVGTGTDNGVSQTSYSTITGAGTFTVTSTNSGSQFVVQQGSANSGSHLATLDLSGLANFNLTDGRLVIGGFNPGSSGASNWLAGALYLAATNNIRVNGPAPAFDVGDAINNGATSYLYLGRTNAIFADSLTVAHAKATVTMAFNPALAGGNPTFSLNGNTNSRVTTLAVGDFSPQATSSSTTAGTLNLTGGTVNAQVNTCYIGLGQTGAGSGPTTGTLNLGAGVFNVNSLSAGDASINTAVGPVTGTVTITNGTLVVNSNLVLAYSAGAAATVLGTMNATNATMQVNTIVSGGGTSKISLSGGLLLVTNTLGTLAAPLTALTISHGAALQFWVTNNLTNAAVSSVSSDNSGVINIGALPVILAYPSQFPLISCPSGHASGTTFSAGSLPGAYLGYISNDNTSLIWLVVTNGPALPKTDQWGGGVNGNWDTNTLNWTNNAAAVPYRENDLVLFNDSAQTGSVNLLGPTPHTPYGWTVTNNALNYTFSGTNSVGGSVGLIKSGGGSLTLSESGDSFTGGITVNGGTVVLDETANAITGGLMINSGATAQIGNHDAKGSLPSGVIANYGSLVFSQTITNLVSTAISGSGSLTQNGAGTLELAGANNYTGNTLVLQGTLALTGGGSISGSPKVIVSHATLDVSGVAGGATLGNLNMTNGVINVGVSPLGVSGLNPVGSSNTINVVALPGIFFYPTNITLIQSSAGLSGDNFVLGSLPGASPAYTGSLGQIGTAIVLNLTGGPISYVSATVGFSATNAGLVLNPAFCGLSYEKSELTGSLFSSNDTSLVKMFGQIAPAVLRVGGNSVDTTCWGGLSNLTAITSADVNAFAGFVKALPTNWHVIYGLNMSVNNPANCAAEAAYVANALGSSLLGFEIGNEPDLYYNNGIRASTYTYSQFLSQWQVLAAAITNTVPGWAITNGGSGWTLTGPASASNTKGYTVPFAGNEAGIISLLTQHYYRANGQSTGSTLPFLLQPDTSLPGTISNVVTAATAANLPLGFRMSECGSFYNGGAPNVSDAYGTALWTLDFMFTIALSGGQGINFHGGGDGTGYTPIADNGSSVVQARPEYYGLKMFSLLSQGSGIPATLTLASNINFTAYGVRRTTGGISALLINKETNDFAQATVNLGSGVNGAQLIELTGPTLNSTNGYTIGGAEINADGSWTGGVQSVLAAPNGQLTLLVPPITAILLNPVLLPATGTNLAYHVTGNQLTLSWPSNYLGWLLQSNAVSLAITNAWLTVPGSVTNVSYRATLAPAQTNVFYRLAHP